MTEQSNSHGGTSIAAVAGVCALIMLPVVLLTTGGHRPPALPQNKLECTTVGPGYVGFYDPVTHPTTLSISQHVRSVRMCSWEWPSEYVNGEGTSYYENPPTIVVTWSGVREAVDGSLNMYFNKTPLKLG